MLGGRKVLCFVIDDRGLGPPHRVGAVSFRIDPGQIGPVFTRFAYCSRVRGRPVLRLPMLVHTSASGFLFFSEASSQSAMEFRLGRQRDDMAVPGLFLPYGGFLNNIAIVIRDVENSERQKV